MLKYIKFASFDTRYVKGNIFFWVALYIIATIENNAQKYNAAIINGTVIF